MRRFLKNQSGVSMVEFVLAFPIFMMFVVVIVDLGRNTAISNVIRESLAIGLKTATSVANLDVDPNGLPTADYGYQRSKIARGLVQDAAVKLIGGASVASLDTDANTASATGPKLYDIVYSEDRLSDGPDTETYKVAILLPGECATVPSLGITECNRETLGTADTDPLPTQSPEVLIRRHPVKIIAFAHFDSFTPWLFKRYIKFEQFAFRQPIPQGPFPSVIDPQPYTELKTAMDPGIDEPLGDAEEPGPLPTTLQANYDQYITLNTGTPNVRCFCHNIEAGSSGFMEIFNSCCIPTS